MILLKCCTQYVSKFGKFSSHHRIGKIKFSFQSQRRPMPQMFTVKLLISYTEKVMLKILQASPQQYMEQELLDIQAGFRKKRQRNQRTKCSFPIIPFFGSWGKQGSSRKTSISASLITLNL